MAFAVPAARRAGGPPAASVLGAHAVVVGNAEEKPALAREGSVVAPGGPSSLRCRCHEGRCCCTRWVQREASCATDQTTPRRRASRPPSAPRVPGRAGGGPSPAWGMSALPASRRQVRSASAVPASAQRSAIIPVGQRVTRRDTRRTVENVLSMGFVVDSDWRSVRPMPSRSTESVWSSPSRSEEAALGCCSSTEQPWACGWAPDPPVGDPGRGDRGANRVTLAAHGAAGAWNPGNVGPLAAGRGVCGRVSARVRIRIGDVGIRHRPGLGRLGRLRRDRRDELRNGAVDVVELAAEIAHGDDGRELPELLPLE